MFGQDATTLKREFVSYLVNELDRSPRTAESYLYGLQCLERVAGKPAHKLSADDLRAFKRSDYARSTKQAVVVALHQFHAWGALEGKWKLNGIMGVRTPRVVSAPLPPLDSFNARRLLESCRRPLEYRVVYLGLYAGLRIHESAAVTREEWRSDRLVIMGKGRKLREVPIHHEMARLRSEILGETPSSEGVLQSSLARLRSRCEAVDTAGNPARSHALRRTFADTLYERCEAPWEVIATMLGHNLDVTNRYVQPRFGKLRDCLERLDYWGDVPVQLGLF